MKVRRRLEGSRLLTGGDGPEIARVHRLVAAHLTAAGLGEARAALSHYLAERADRVCDEQRSSSAWELDAFQAAIPPILSARDVDDVLLRDLANATLVLSDKVKEYRSLAAVGELLHSAHAVLRQLAERDPSYSEWQRELPQSRWRRLWRRILRRAAAPAKGGWQHGLSASLDRLGDLAEARGDREEAQRLFSESLRIAQRLADADPANAAWQHGLSVSHWKIAGLLEKQGDQEAVAHRQKARDIRAAMVQNGFLLPAQDSVMSGYLQAEFGP
jgi:tetratricopeptide (TPR) repeat protein